MFATAPRTHASRGRHAFVVLALILGALLTPSIATADDPPDITRPNGAIGRPATIVAGVPAQFTANVTDDPFGSGMDPAGYAWTIPGQAARTGASTFITFPTAGPYSVTLNFRDLAGNTGTLTATGDVLPDQSVLPPAELPVPRAKVTKVTTKAVKAKGGRKAKKATTTWTVTLAGKITPVAGPPRSVVCAGHLKITLKKGSSTVGTGSPKLTTSTCGYRQSLTIAGTKIGKAKTLGLTVRFAGNSAMRATTKGFLLALTKTPAVREAK
jgi:hypothetical protein